MTPGIIKKLYHTTPVGLTDENKQEVYPITATSAVYSAPGESSFPNMSLDNILDALNQGYHYMGKASPNTNPGVFNHKVFYLASEAGTYSHFDGITVSGLTVLKSDGNGWSADTFNITGGGGGGLTTAYIGTTMVQETPAPQQLSGISQLNLTSGARIYFGETAYIELDQYGFHFSQGIYSDSFVSAGGIGSGGGGGGGGSYAAGNGITIANDTISVKIGTGLSFDASGALTASGIGSESDPVFVASPAHGITSSDITNWRAAKYTLGTGVGTAASRGTLYGATGISAYLSGTSNDDSLIVWDSQHGAWHFTGNLYADGWVSAGGVGSGSGNATSLYSLAEVLSTTNPTTGQIFYFNGSKWTSVSLKTINNESLLGSGDIEVLGSSGYIGYTAVQSTAQAQYLFGIPYINATNVASSPSRIVWDSTNNAWHFYGNLYADGWVSAGGIGSGGSVSGSIVSIDDLVNTGGLIGTLTIDGYDYAIKNGVLWGTYDATTHTVQVTINGTSRTLLLSTALSGYATQTWVQQQNYLTSHQAISTLTLNAGSFTAGTWTPTGNGRSFNIPTTLDHIGDGTNRKLSDYVTLATTQTITGAKTFSSNPVTIGSSSGLVIDGASYLDIGNARLVYDSINNALHVTNRTGTSVTISLYADGEVSAGGI